MNTALELKKQLRVLLDNRYSLEELRDLCFDLDVDYDDLPGETRSGKIRELILYLSRRGQVDLLIDAVRQSRPDIIVPVLSGEAEEWEQKGLLDLLSDEAVMLDFMTKGEVAAAEGFDPLRRIVQLYSNLTPELQHFGRRMSELKSRAEQGQLTRQTAQAIMNAVQAEIKRLTSILTRVATDVEKELPAARPAWKRSLDAIENASSLLSPFAPQKNEARDALMYMQDGINAMSRNLVEPLVAFRATRTALSSLESQSGALSSDLQRAVRRVGLTLDQTIQEVEAMQARSDEMQQQIAETLSRRTEDQSGRTP